MHSRINISDAFVLIINFNFFHLNDIIKNTHLIIT